MAIGIEVVLRDARTLDDVGVCTAPAPVEPGDLIALEYGPPFRVVAVLPLTPNATCTPVLAMRAPFAVASRL